MLIVRRDILGKDEDKPAMTNNQATSSSPEDDEENEEDLLLLFRGARPWEDRVESVVSHHVERADGIVRFSNAVLG
jgi:hypothetical protein